MSGPTASDAPAHPKLTPPPGAREPVRHPDAPEPGTLLGAHYDHCFGCGEEQPHGLRLKARAGDGVSITAEFTVRPVHQGAPGLAHGGVLATALDETLGSLNGLLRIIAVTGHLQTDYVRPVPVGTVLHLAARCTAVHERKIYSSAVGRLDSAEGPVAVRAEALFIQVPVKHFTEHGRDEDIQAAMDNPDHTKVVRAFEVNP